MNATRGIPDRLCDWLQSRYLPWYLALVAMVLCAPSLRVGRHLDDDFHRLALTRPDLPALSRSPAELFVFIEGNDAANRMAITLGMLPWWCHEGLRLAFFRPLTGLTHWLDYRMWPDTPWLMHLQSLLWFGGVVVVASCFYRRMLGPTWIAGLAALLFAVDDAHGLPAVWLANRNALIGVLFGLLSLVAYDRWRRDGWWVGAILAPSAFALGLLAKESALSLGGYLFAYALFLDRGTLARRLGCLAPCALVGAVWSVAYRACGYGTAGSGWYVDPGTHPLLFAQAVAARTPNLLAWQWMVPSDLKWSLSAQAAHNLWLAVMGLLVIIAVALAPLVRRDPLARFWALGMILSLLPACTAYPADRLLFFVGIGGMGLLAQFIAAVLRSADWLPVGALWRLPTRALCAVLVLVHLVMAPLNLARTAGSLKRLGRTVAQAADSLPADPNARFQRVLIVSSPTYASFAYGALRRLVQGEPYLNPTIVMGSGCHAIDIHRPDERTLLVRPQGGFLAPAGMNRPGGEAAPLLFDQRRALLTLDRLYRDRAPMAVGQRTALLGATLEITALTDDGRPAEAAFHFGIELENPLFRWLRWQGGSYVPFDLPAVGQTVTLPPAEIPLLPALRVQ